MVNATAMATQHQADHDASEIRLKCQQHDGQQRPVEQRELVLCKDAGRYRANQQEQSQGL
jgi:hypothetical protein